MKQTMKPLLKAAALLAAISALHGCTKENAARFEGDYSFSTSGTISAVPEDLPENTTDDIIHINLPDEHGQMSIVRKDKSKNDMAVTMNIIGGNTVVFENVSAEGKVMTLLEPYAERRIPFISESAAGTARISVSGTGEKFTDVIIFRIEYTGTVTIRDRKYRITGSDIDCIAKEND